ncbi:PROTEIN DISULFIDE ISOMERASE 2, ARABIDOPSIS THALIANA PROTEIN DISULFIDE ISOMERASE 2, PDI-like 1-4 [Hibiscus trionum]|uniref:Protein disulfide isomerase-like 1-4 n=1 Tax=Hibiscus trionum TaxID=183268 RepID=A0A9W7M6Q6_HIBTR|nr:PROTEIN DISULFIDE ISOMERASE 2, ARABIDOPSIS THALIANA PROTEIN DISULFIDE ISOMERASE 2, PDI-like 1-4 [Hibiscus trionum]
MTSLRCFLILYLTSFLLLSTVIRSITTNDEEDDEDLRFLEEIEGQSVDSGRLSDSSDSDDDQLPGEKDADGEDSESGSEQDLHDLDPDTYKAPVFDEKDVVILAEGNFSDFIGNNKYVVIEFYAPWCGHSQALAPEYAAAATELKGEGVVLAKVDATEEDELAQKYDVQGFPTVYLFVDGEHKPYPAAQNKEAIVTWIKKNIGPGVFNVTTLDDAERILASQSKVVLGYLNFLVGPESDELAAASKLLDDVSVYQTVDPDIAKLFHIDPQVERPALVLVKREAEKICHFDGQFVKTAISEFVTSNKLPLVTTFNRDTAPSIFESSIKNHLLLFATLNISEKFIPVFQEAAKLFKGKLISIYVQVDNEDSGRPVAKFFGVSGDGPRILAYSGTDARKFAMDGDVTLHNIKAFAEDFLEDRLKPYYKSDPIPETNEEDVKVVVANSFDEIVLDESKDVLLQIYAPWCGHCRSLEPIYNKLAKHLEGIDSLVIAKMDGTTNEHPRARKSGFPTVLFFPAGNKSSDPIKVNTERSVVAYYKFLKKHASIPFKLKKPVSTPKDKPASDQETKPSDSKESDKSSSADMKDEL